MIIKNESSSQCLYKCSYISMFVLIINFNFFSFFDYYPISTVSTILCQKHITKLYTNRKVNFKFIQTVHPKNNENKQ